MHHVGFIDAEDMNVTSGKRKYTSLVGYSGSKLAQVHFLFFYLSGHFIVRDVSLHEHLFFFPPQFIKDQSCFSNLPSWTFGYLHVMYLCIKLQVMFSSVLNKRLPAEAGISVVCVSPGIVQTNVVSLCKNLNFIF